jgi:two-component system sensor histidine kinase ArlS
MFYDNNNQEKDKEVTYINQLSNTMNHAFTKLLSNFRLSISLRITLNYCRMLIKSALFILMMATIILCGNIYYQIVQQGDEAAQILQNQTKAGRVSAEQIADILDWKGLRLQNPQGGTFETGWPDQNDLTQYWWSGAGGPLLINKNTKVVYLRLNKSAAVNNSIWHMEYIYSLKQWQHIYYYFILGLLLIDIIRILYFLIKSKALNQGVLQPIEEISEIARRITAENLSQRINVHGTKNELKDLAIIINELLDRLEAAYNSQKQFVSDASHELRTPIAVIQGYASLLERWGKSDPAVTAEALSAIVNEAANMQSLVENLLFIARHDKKTWNLNLESILVQDLVESIAKETELLSSKHRIIIGPLEECLVEADKNALKQALRIFADNSIKYTPENGEIRFSCRRENQWAALTVEDMGQGISKEDLKMIFNRFYRADQARNTAAGRQGHGLGLAIAKIIVSAHKGKIRVRSKLNQGSEFTILLKRKV